MGRASRPRNEKLLAHVRECQWSYNACAVAVRAVAYEDGNPLPSCDRSHVGHWIAGVKPGEKTSRYLAEAISRRPGRVVDPGDLGLVVGDSLNSDLDGLDW